MTCPDVEVSLLTGNLKAQAMYAWCNVDGNKYLLLECLADAIFSVVDKLT